MKYRSAHWRSGTREVIAREVREVALHNKEEAEVRYVPYGVHTNAESEEIITCRSVTNQVFVLGKMKAKNVG